MFSGVVCARRGGPRETGVVMKSVQSQFLLGVCVLAGMVLGAQRAGAAAVTFQARPAQVTAMSGKRVTAALRIAVSGGSRVRVSGMWANLGTVDKVRSLGAGVWAAKWTSPVMGFPTVVLLRADLLVEGRPERHWLTLPVSIRQDMEIQATKGENVQVMVMGHDYGPVKARSTGPVRVQVVVPPWATTYSVMRTDAYDVTKSETRHFNLPAFKRMALVVPKSASAGDVVHVEVFQVSSRGQRYTYSNPLVLTCPGAAVEDIQDLKSVQRFTVRLGGQTGELTCTLFMKVEPKVVTRFTLDVDVSRRLALGLRVSRERFKMASAQSAKVEVTVADLFGNVSDTEKLEVTANGRPLAMSRVGAGVYRGWLYAPARRQPGDRVVVRAVAPGAKAVSRIVGLDGGPATRLVARIAPGEIMADGKASALLEVKATDRLGMPATDRTLRADSDQGKMAFLHRVRPGLFRGRFVPARRPQGGQAVLVVQTRRAPAVTVRLRLRRIPHRFMISPWAGGFFDLSRTAGATASLRFEWTAYRGKPSVFIGGAVLLSPHLSTEDGTGDLVDHRGLSAGVVALGRFRVVSTRRVALDVGIDLGVLGVYSSYRERYDHLVQRNQAGTAAFTAAASLELGLATTGAQEVFLLVQARYLTGRFADAASRNSATVLGGLGYRFAL